MAADRVDALVIFGATGDLAKLETFPALVGLVERGVLDVPIIGVAKSGWDLDRFRNYAAQSLRNNGMDPESAPARTMLGLLRYVDGDLDDARDLRGDVAGDGQRKRGPVLPGGAAVPVRPHRRGHLNGRPGRRRPGDGGEALRQRPGRRRGTQRDDAAVLPRGRHLPGRPLAGPRPAQQRARRPVRQLDNRAAAQPRPRREHPDHDGRGLRRLRPRPVLRPDRRHPRRRAEPHAAGAGHRARRSTRRVRPRLVAATRRPGWWPRSARSPPPTPSAANTRATTTSTGSTPSRPRRATSRCDSRSTRGDGPACRSSSGPARRCRSRPPR